MKNDRMKMPTIYNIADMTGFTAATVSRALNNKGYVSKNTKEIIFKAAEKLNYSPNPAARYLRTKKTYQLMLSIPHMNDIFYFDLISSVYNVANENGYTLIINYTQESMRDELRMLKNIENHLIDGLILISINFTERYLNEIRKIKKPIVLSSIGLNESLGRKRQFFDYVGVDTKKGTYLATEHLIKQGHVKIGYIGLPLNTQTGDERFEGFSQAMRQENLKINRNHVVTGGYSEAFGYEAGLKLIDHGDLPTAICTTCDHITLGLYRIFEEKGIRIPEDMATIGMDNINITNMVRPKMSSVAIASDSIGKIAAELIFKRFEKPDKNYERIIFQPRLVIRDSSINIKKSQFEK